MQISLGLKKCNLVVIDLTIPAIIEWFVNYAG